MASRRKRCMVYTLQTRVHKTRSGADLTETGMFRCEAKIKPGTPFCKEHFETHKLVEVKCTGEAHSNPFIDHCGVCMPHWGRYPAAVPKGDTSLPDWTKEGWE